MRASSRLLLGALVAGLVLGAGTLAAQTMPASATADYTYDPEGRRDPFRSLISRGTDAPPDHRPAGLPGLLVSEAAVRGILQSGDETIAMLQGPDQKTYTARAGDRLLDGAVKLVEPAAVVFVQDVDDPLSAVKQREIRKPLRTLEDAR